MGNVGLRRRGDVELHIIVIHPSLLIVALVAFTIAMPVHSTTVFCYCTFGRPFLLLPSAVPCRIVFDIVSDLIT